MSRCNLCPRRCGADRASGETGFCRQGAAPKVARAAPHFGEEPCISGTRGSGAVFFTGCNLQCVFCQNREISFEGRGQEVSVQRLAEIFKELDVSGVHNLNLVTGVHFTDSIFSALKLAAPKIPVVWNSSAYENAEVLQGLQGLVSVYMPDLKYSLPQKAGRYSGAEDYPETAKAAIREMFRQVGPCKFDSEGILQKGVLIRHLMLPGCLEDSLDIIDWVSSEFPRGAVLFSLMSQFTPLAHKTEFPELSRTISETEHLRAREYLNLSGIKKGYFQEPSSATEEMIPDFDLTGI